MMQCYYILLNEMRAIHDHLFFPTLRSAEPAVRPFRKEIMFEGLLTPDLLTRLALLKTVEICELVESNVGKVIAFADVSTVFLRPFVGAAVALLGECDFVALAHSSAGGQFDLGFAMFRCTKKLHKWLRTVLEVQILNPHCPDHDIMEKTLPSSGLRWKVLPMSFSSESNGGLRPDSVLFQANCTLPGDAFWDLNRTRQRLTEAAHGFSGTGKLSPFVDPFARIEQLHSLAVQRMEAGAILEAERLLKRIVQLRPRNPDFQNQLGVVLHKTGKSGDAIEAFLRSSKLRPARHQVWTNLGGAYLAVGDLDRAADACDRALRLAPKSKAANQLCRAIQLSDGNRAHKISPSHHKPKKLYFGELGTDKIIRERFFGDWNYKGVMVEIGAATPVFLSMSQHFRINGWRCVGVEPNPRFAAMHRTRGNEIYEYACGNSDLDDQEFEICHKSNNAEVGISDHSNSGLSIKESYKTWDADSFDPKQIVKIKVKVRRLDTILAEADVRKLDFLCIDVEGWELEVMAGFNIQSYRPAVVLLENLMHDPQYVQYMKNLNYALAMTVEYNYIFVPQA